VFQLWSVSYGPLCKNHVPFVLLPLALQGFMFYSCYLYLFTYWCSTRFPDQITFMLFLQWNRNCFPSGAPEFTTVFEGFLLWNLSFMCDIFKILSCLPLNCLFFDLRLLITPFGMFNLFLPRINHILDKRWPGVGMRTDI
jgi:hypothetical protein